MDVKIRAKTTEEKQWAYVQRIAVGVIGTELKRSCAQSMDAQNPTQINHQNQGVLNIAGTLKRMAIKFFLTQSLGTKQSTGL